MRHKWQGRVIVSPEHHKHLEAESAHQELGADKTPRAQAEEAVYQKYKTAQHSEAAAHHLRNLRLAVSTGEKKEAEKHSVLYKLHAQALGHNPNHPPSPEIHAAASKPMTQKSHRFTNHPADALIAAGPLGKSAREAVGYWTLVKSDGDGQGDVGSDQPIQAAPDQSASVSASASSSAEPSASASSGSVKAPSAPAMPGGGKHSEAGPQHFDKGSVVLYRGQSGENAIPSNWIGTVRAHHMLKIHGIKHAGHMHYYEVTWRTPEGKFVEDFFSQEELAPYKARR